MQLLATVRADADVTALHMLARLGLQGEARFVAVGDVLGRIYLYDIKGTLLQELDTGEPSCTFF